MARKEIVSVRLEPYQIATINGIAKKNNESPTDVHRRMIDFATNKVNEGCIAIALDTDTLALLKTVSAKHGKSESDYAAEIITAILPIL